MSGYSAGTSTPRPLEPGNKKQGLVKAQAKLKDNKKDT